MNPTLPISRFVDPEPEGKSVPGEPTVQPADTSTGVMRMTPEEQHAQVCKQLARAPLALDPTVAWRADLEADSAEVLKSKHCDALAWGAEAKRRAEADRLAEANRGAEAIRRTSEAVVDANEVDPYKEPRPRTAWAKKYQQLRQYPYSPEFYAFRCGARTRAGTPCKLRPDYFNGRCKFHGGASTGPKTAQGRRQSALNGRNGGRPRKPVIDQEPKT